jgi:hypothetical protein
VSISILSSEDILAASPAVEVAAEADAAETEPQYDDPRVAAEK